VKRARNRDARNGLGLTAAAASLGLSCLGGAFAPTAALAQYFQGTDTVYSRPRVPAAIVTAQPPRKRTSTKTAESAKAAKPEAPKPPSGPLILAVSIGSQRVVVYDNGTPIASAPISSGMPGRPTPMGVFSVIQKDRYHHSNLYSNAPMPYMQRITWSGVALHAGVLPGYPASHGCIRLPESFAVRLWGMTKMGARVVVTRNEVAPYEINHPRLASIAKRPDPVPPPEARNDAPKPEAGIVEASKSDASKSETAGEVVVASTAPSADTVTDGTGVLENLHDIAEHVGAVARNDPPAPALVQRVAAVDKPAELRPAVDTFGPDHPVPMPLVKPADASLRSGQLSMFVSRKEGKLFVRKGFEPVFETPVTIAHKELPLGTHVFTASRPTDGSAGVRWLAVSIGYDRQPAAEPERQKGKGRAAREERPATPSSEGLRKSAAEALDRIELPPEALDRISPLLAPGASLLISDQGLGGETGKETDFIVVTR
jgi:lipoprotein-anchoring transpeptidase ErfK/SrfK